MNPKFKFRIVSGLYDVQLDELRPQFGLERQKKNRAPPPDRTFLTAPCLFHPVHSSWQSRRCSMGWCFLPPLQPLPHPCIHACAHPHAIIRTAVVRFTSDAQLTSFPTLPSLFAGSICCWRRRLGGGNFSFEFALCADLLALLGTGQRQVRS